MFVNTTRIVINLAACRENFINIHFMGEVNSEVNSSGDNDYTWILNLRVFPELEDSLATMSELEDNEVQVCHAVGSRDSAMHGVGVPSLQKQTVPKEEILQAV
jgi:hypothetical protein